MDEWLMQQVVDGDRKAFSNLVARYQDHVLRIAYRFLGKREDAEDAAQEVFLKLYLHRQEYKNQGLFKSFLSRIAVNECLNRIRNQRGHSTFSLENIDDLPAKPGQENKNGENGEIKEELQEALSELPDRQRLAFLMKIYGELSYQEIGENLGCSRIAIEGLIFRARQTLQKRLHHLTQEKSEELHGL